MRLNYGYRFASPALALLWTFRQRGLLTSSFTIVPTALTHSKRSSHNRCITYNAPLPYNMPLNNSTTRAAKRAINIPKQNDEPVQNEQTPKTRKRGLQRSLPDEGNEDISVNKAQTKAVPTATNKPKPRKTLVTPIDDDEEVQTKPQPKKVAAPKHQVFTFVDPLPKLWNMEEHKDSYSECFSV